MGVERGLLASGLAEMTRLRHRRSSLILAYHDIVPTGAATGGEHSLHLSQTDFSAQLDYLRANYRVVALDELFGHESRRERSPRVAITFDDAYRGAVTAGAQELTRRDLPATFFVAPGCLGRRSFWWDELLGQETPGERLRQIAISDLHGDDGRIRRWAKTQGSEFVAPPDFVRPATEGELAELGRHKRISLASHSWSHVNLVGVTKARAHQELRRSLAWLRRNFAFVVPWISYPYGTYDPSIGAIAEQCGYAGGLRISGGWVNGRPADPMGLPRLNVPAGVSLDGFKLRLAGVLAR